MDKKTLADYFPLKKGTVIRKIITAKPYNGKTVHDMNVLIDTDVQSAFSYSTWVRIYQSLGGQSSNISPPNVEYGNVEIMGVVFG